MKVELQLNEEELEQLFFTVQEARDSVTTNMINMENQGYREGNDTMKSAYALTCKWEKIWKRIEEDLEKQLPKY